MRVMIFLLFFLQAYLLTVSVNAASLPLLKPDDIDRTPTAQAIVTFGTGGSAVQAMIFNKVPDLQSCFNLAYTAADKGRQSTATCLDARKKVIERYFCAPKPSGTPSCQSFESLKS